jgi:glycosyl transferase family WecB/TagA/CpsF
VGAAFDCHAGTLKRAPFWMQRRGLEWLYRLLREPKRLWRRYLKTNTIFLLRITEQFIREHKRAVEQDPVSSGAAEPGAAHRAISVESPDWKVNTKEK